MLLIFRLMKILLGAVLGSVISIGNFIILCLTVQSALEIEKERKRRYTRRCFHKDKDCR